jgi:glycerol uptake facilitator-like aquaporin
MFRVNRAVVAPVLAEFVGTGFLVMIALILGQTTAVSYFIATSLAIAAAAVFMLFGVVSGAHTNPAITFGLWTARRVGTIRAISYIAAQLLGGVASWQLFQYLTNHTLTARSATFSTPIWLAEVVGTAILGMAFAAALSRRFDTYVSGVLVGAAYFVGVVIAATASSGYINPAIAMGSRAWSAAYVLGPLVGGLIGVNLYNYMLGSTATARVASASARTVTPDDETAEARPASRRVTVKRTTARRRRTTTRTR